jgi:hypothetical protein
VIILTRLPVLGIDVGGTNTDAALIIDGEVAGVAKVPTDPESLVRSTAVASTEALSAAGRIKKPLELHLSTTLSTNAIVEGRGDPGMLYVMEHLVLPILRDWQPHLIVNAAGQDNHYTDPLTNMNFTAQGYARLTQMLAPGIVVLEGGYSIEGALPYVNLGILLALAGLDFGAVREPDWRPDVVAQPREISNAIARTVAALQDMWASRRDADLEAIFGAGQFFRRRRDIYYDTDNIAERQNERIRLCEACSGWRSIQSEALHAFSGRTVRIGVVIIPRQACRQCRMDAQGELERLSAEVRAGRLNLTYLQDIAGDS